MENIKVMAENNGFKMSDMIKALVFLTNMYHQPSVNEQYIKFFEDGNLPARSCIAVHQLPKGGLVEIECVFFRP